MNQGKRGRGRPKTVGADARRVELTFCRSISPIIDGLIGKHFVSAREFAREMMMIGIRSAFPDEYQDIVSAEACMAARMNDVQATSSIIKLESDMEVAMTALSSLRSEVAELRAAITMRAPANEESAS
jgi:hypothetical protein